MSNLVPNSKPQMSAEDVKKILKAMNIDRSKFPVCVLAVRGYYLDSMGVAGKNDRQVYDDACFVDSDTLFSSVNWNVDPNGYRKGSGKGSNKGMASLKLGVWDYEIGKHKSIYPAGVQAGEVTVIRDGNPDYEDTGWFGINLHPGGSASTSSIGCQTAPPSQWPSFITPLVSELKRYSQKVFKYVLIDHADMESILADSKPIPTDPPPVSKQDLTPAVTIIKEFEGFFPNAYLDPVGVPTIGWGTIKYPNGKMVKMGEHCTSEEGLQYLMFEMSGVVEDIKKLVKVPISNNSMCALISFCYNLGSGALAKSTMLRLLNGGAPIHEVGKEFGKWINAGGHPLNGLIRRREAERVLFEA